ncbi:MAG: mechanosensitive ion channel family protein [Desulfatiglandaceae bacterium]
MNPQLSRLEGIGNIMTLYGQEVLVALAILVGGLIVTRQFVRLLRLALRRLTTKQPLIATVSNVVYITLLVFVAIMVLHQLGLENLLIRRIVIFVALAAVGLMVLFRPYIPSLPFKVGNTIKTGNLFGKVEATTFLNTRLRTFEGLTVFVPNSKILNDYVINYHFTPTRRVKLDVGIRYDQDVLRAKQVMEAIMVEDPRVNTKPRPVVYVLDLGDSCVKLGGRCWVENLKYWVTKCDLVEKVKLRFDQEGIIIAFPQRDVHLYHETPAPGFPELESPGAISIQPDRHESV